MQVRTLSQDISQFCNNVPDGYKVIEKSIIEEGVATYCCSIIPSAYVIPLRYELEKINGDWEPCDEVEDYESDINTEVEALEPYYSDYHNAVKNSELDAAIYEDLEDAIETHNCNHCF
jgi:hypothetical protein